MQALSFGAAQAAPSEARSAPRVSALPAVAIGSAPPGGIVHAAIRTSDGHYLTIVNEGGLGYVKNAPQQCALYTDARSPGPHETFAIEWLDAAFTRFTLKTQSGTYVTALHGGGVGGPNDNSSPVHTDAVRLGPWEKLTLDFLPLGKLVISTGHGHYLTALNGGGITGQSCPAFSTLATVAGPAETFTLEPVTQAPAGGHTGWPTPKPRPPLLDDPDTGIRQLQEDTQVRWAHPGDGMLFPIGRPPALLDPKSLSRSGVQEAALKFLRRYGAIWHMADPMGELRVSRYSPGDGATIVFDQWNGGVVVFDRGVLVNFDGTGRLTLVNSDYVPGLDELPKKPRKSVAEIEKLLIDDAGNCGLQTTAPCQASLSKPVLGIEADPTGPPQAARLVYKASVASEGFVLDANTGEILARHSLIMTATKPLATRPSVLTTP